MRQLGSVVICILTLTSPASAAMLDVFAGGTLGDGKPGVAAPLLPAGVAVGPDGTVYVSEFPRKIFGNGNQTGMRVRRIDATTGMISTLAGRDGVSGFCGDGGPATAACVQFPGALAIDAAGNVLFGDDHRIRRVDVATGTISTIAGTGSLTAAGDGGPATVAGIDSVGALAVDTVGDVFLATDFMTVLAPPAFFHTTGGIRRIDASSQTITTIAGNGAPGACGSLCITPRGLAVDGTGGLLFTDGDPFGSPAIGVRLRRIDLATDAVQTIAGNGSVAVCGDGGPATAACLGAALGVALDGVGDVFLNDGTRVRRIDAVTQDIDTIAGNGSTTFCGDGGPATAACFNGSGAVAADAAGNVYLTDNRRLRRVDAASHTIETVAGNGTKSFCGDGDAAVTACLDAPSGITRDPLGNVIVADAGNRRLRRIDATSGVITTVAGAAASGPCTDGAPPTDQCFVDVGDVVTDAGGSVYFAALDEVRRIDPVSGLVVPVAGNGRATSCGDGGPAVAACVVPLGLALDGAGNLFIAGDGRIRRVDAGSGIIDTVAGDGYPNDFGPGGIVLDGQGGAYVSDAGNAVVWRVDLATGARSVFAGRYRMRGFCGDGGPPPSACLGSPGGLAVDAAGNLFIADAGNANVRMVDAYTGLIGTIAGSGSEFACGTAGDPLALCLRPGSLIAGPGPQLLVSDLINDRIWHLACDDADGNGLCDGPDGTNSCPDVDGDHVCDAYDLSDLPGLSLSRLMVRSTSAARYNRVEFAGTLALGSYPTGPTGLADALTANGFSVAVYATYLSADPPTYLTPPVGTVTFPASGCRLAATATSLSGRCRIADRATRQKLRVVFRSGAPGTTTLTGRLVGLPLIFPATEALHLVLSPGDPAPLDYLDSLGNDPGETCTLDVSPYHRATSVRMECFAAP